MFCLEQEWNKFLVSPVTPQMQITMSSSLKAYSLSHGKGTEKASVPGGEVTLPPSSYFYSAVSKMIPRHGTKPIFIADGFSCLPERSSTAENTLVGPVFPEKISKVKTAVGALPWK